MSRLTDKLFGTHSEREVKRIRPLVDRIEALRPQMQALTDEELRGKTEEFRKRYELPEQYFRTEIGIKAVKYDPGKEPAEQDQAR